MFILQVLVGVLAFYAIYSTHSRLCRLERTDEKVNDILNFISAVEEDYKTRHKRVKHDEE